MIYFKKSFIRYVAYFLVGLLFSLFFSFRVSAATVTGCIDSGTSLKNSAKIGSRVVGTNYFYEFAPNTWDSSPLDIDFCTDYNSEHTATTGVTNVHFSVDYCVNGSQPNFQIWSTYYNNIDFTYYLNQSIYLSDGEWSKAYCYRSFITLQLNYSDNISVTSNLNFTNYTDRNNTFAMQGLDSFNKILRYNDLVYYNAIDYNAVLSQAKIEAQNNAINNSINDINSSINNDNVSEANSQATDFFEDFTTDTHGLTSIITAPLTSIASLTSSTCSPLVLPLPFVDSSLTLPCMREIYDENFGAFMTIYDIIVIGIISYWIIVRIFTLVKDFKNPEHDEVEVMEL